MSRCGPSRPVNGKTGPIAHAHRNRLAAHATADTNRHPYTNGDSNSPDTPPPPMEERCDSSPRDRSQRRNERCGKEKQNDNNGVYIKWQTKIVGIPHSAVIDLIQPVMITRMNGRWWPRLAQSMKPVPLILPFCSRHSSDARLWTKSCKTKTPVT